MISEYLTSTDLIASSVAVLEAAGYKATESDNSAWTSSTSRLFENSYNVVGVVAFETYVELVDSWADRQGMLVEIISRSIGRSEGKAWDGYLVLLTPAVKSSTETDIEAIRRDTTRLRKLIATGDDLKKSSDVERVLRPLLPIKGVVNQSNAGSALDHLSSVLEKRGVERQDAVTLVEAFLDQRPLMESLHRSGSKDQ
ncbi:hypothetical protein [Novilysobacter erysipheiresistens]|uniref:Uncharacterized protein n=1 Tax=Novilysobacter erysipheiresistens TaxID=1749332 RepID=A0ABU7YW64_9GAMM